MIKKRRTTWGDELAPIIERVIREVGRSDPKALRLALCEARPHWARRGWIYKAWRYEVRRQLGLPRHRAREPRTSGPPQRLLFAALLCVGLVAGGCSTQRTDGLLEGQALVTGVTEAPPEIRLDFMRRPHTLRGEKFEGAAHKVRVSQHVKVLYTRRKLSSPGIEQITVVDVLPE